MTRARMRLTGGALGAQSSTVDADKVNAEHPDAVVFNGYANQ